MSSSFDKLKWTMAFNRARTLEEFVALGQKRGYRTSWAYRAYAARLDMMENFQRDMDRVRKSWDEFGKAAGHTARILEKKIGGSMSAEQRAEFCRNAQARHDAAVERNMADPEVRAVLDETFGKAACVVVQKPRQHSKTYGLGDPYDDQEGGAA